MLRLILSALVLASTMIAQPHAQASPQRGEPRAPRSTSVVVNLNTATTAELEQLPGIGPKTAARIVDYRQKKGPFKKIEELMNVQGIGEKSFLRIRAQLTVGSKGEASNQQQ